MVLNDDDDYFKILLEDIIVLWERSFGFVLGEVSVEDVVDIDSGVLIFILVYWVMMIFL